MVYAINDLNHADIRIRLEAMRDFRLAGKAALPDLLGAFEHPELEVRWRAAATLGWIGEPESVSAIVRLNQTAVYETQINCTWALGQIGHSSVIPPLVAILHAGESASPDVRYAAALALARLGQTETLREALREPAHPAYRVANAALTTVV